MVSYEPKNLSMQRLPVLYLLLTTFLGFGQNPCFLETPQGLRSTTPSPIFIGDSVLFTIDNPVIDSQVVYVLYYDYCCDNPLATSTDGIFTYPITDSGIFMVRRESLCDTSDAVGIDIDAHPRITGIPTISQESTDTLYYDIWGRVYVHPLDHGYYIHGRKLFFRNE